MESLSQPPEQREHVGDARDESDRPRIGRTVYGRNPTVNHVRGSGRDLKS